MVVKTSFTPNEWREILQSPMIVGIAVSAAEPSGLVGILKESMASARALLEVRADPSADELIKAVVADFGTSEGQIMARTGLKTALSGSSTGDIKAKAMESLSQVSSLLDAKAPADAAAFKTWLRHVAQSVAEAAKEGGFLGFGGVAVTPAEQATLAEISRVLGLPAV
jgi:hypothetical protein